MLRLTNGGDGDAMPGSRRSRRQPKSLEAVRRREALSRYHEGISRGRHPRSFPHREGIWDLVHKSTKRLARVQSGGALDSVLGVEHGRANEVLAALQRESNNFSRDNSRPWSGEASVLGKSAADDSGGEDRHGPGHGFADPVALARGYTANYESSEQRRERMRRRMSDYRRAAQPFSSFRRRNAARGAGTPEMCKRRPALTKSEAPALRKQKRATGGVTSFMADARRQGHHRRNETVMCYMAIKGMEESEAPGSARSKRQGAKRGPSSATAAGKRTTASTPEPSAAEQSDAAGDRAGEGGLGLFSIEDLRQHNSDEEARPEVVEFAPSHVESNLFYGSQIALEYHDGSFLTVSEPRGTVSWMKHPRTQVGDGAPDESDTLDSKHSDSIGGVFDETTNEGGSRNALPPVTVDRGHTILFTLVNLNDPEYVGPICSGDDIWLCVHPGQGQFTWKEGSILGSRVTGGACVETVPIDSASAKSGKASASPVPGAPSPLASPATSPTQESTNAANPSASSLVVAPTGGAKRPGQTASSQQGSESIGTLLPILCYIPKLPGQTGHGEKSLDDLYRDATNIQRIQKLNRTACHLGQWKVMAASNTEIRAFRAQQKQSSALDGGSGEGKAVAQMPIANNMAVYLEQDWVYITAVEPEKETLRERLHVHGTAKLSMDAALKALPTVSAGGRSRFCVERNAVAYVRLVQSKLRASTNSHKSVEQTLYRARVQLKTSESGRNGKRMYLPGLKSGAQFSTQMRKLRARLECRMDDRFLQPVEEVHQDMPRYFYDRFQGLSRAMHGGGEETGHKAPQSASPTHAADEPASSRARAEGKPRSAGAKAVVQGARDFIRNLERALEREACCRDTEAYRMRLAEQNVTPWYEAVYKLKLQDQSLMTELYRPRGKARLKASALTLLGGKSESAAAEQTRAAEQREAMREKPIYAKLVAEDQRIKSFVLGRNGPAASRSPPLH